MFETMRRYGYLQKLFLHSVIYSIDVFFFTYHMPGTGLWIRDTKMNNLGQVYVNIAYSFSDKCYENNKIDVACACVKVLCSSANSPPEVLSIPKANTFISILMILISYQTNCFFKTLFNIFQVTTWQIYLNVLLPSQRKHDRNWIPYLLLQISSLSWFISIPVSIFFFFFSLLGSKPNRCFIPLSRLPYREN